MAKKYFKANSQLVKKKKKIVLMKESDLVCSNKHVNKIKYLLYLQT